jgi:hypothetical protein
MLVYLKPTVRLPQTLANNANINPYRWVSLRERAMLSEGKCIVRKAECYAERRLVA